MKTKFENFKNKKLNIVLIQGSPRYTNNCPGENSKTSKIINHVKDTIKDVKFEVIDLKIEPDKMIIQPCKGCISTAGGAHCHYPCIPGDQRVKTEFGYKRMDEINIGEKLPNGIVTEHMITGINEDIYELKLTDGRKLNMTSNHKIKILSKERFRDKESDWKYYRKETWKELKDIKIGDLLPTIDKNYNTFNDKTKYDNNLFLLGGLIWGDGTFCDNSALLYYDNISEYEFGENIKEKLNFFVSVKPHNTGDKLIRDNSSNNSEMIKINYGAKIGKILKNEMGFLKVDSHHRRLPSILYECSEIELCNFFNGWFSTDGHVYNGISLTNASYDCLRDAQLLLSKIGIDSSISDNRHLSTDVRGEKIMRASVLSIFGYSNIKTYYDKIGFLHNEKMKKVESIIENYNIKQKQNDRPTKVKSIKYIGKDVVYDITVDISHEFECEGIVVHNCDCYDKDNDKMYSENIYEKLEKCDAFIVFTPIHWSAASSQVKTLFDRLVCINQTITHDQATELYDNFKDPKETIEFEGTQVFQDLIKNHFEGKVAAFYAFGDDGADDYKSGNLPEVYKKYCCEFTPKQTMMPYAWQMRYSGVDVPDDFIEAFYLKDKVSYSKENENFYDGDYDFMYDKAIKLVNKVIKKIK